MRTRSRSHAGSIILIVVGAILLLVNLGIVPAAELKALFAQWWPLLLVVIGVWRIAQSRIDDRKEN